MSEIKAYLSELNVIIKANIVNNSDEAVRNGAVDSLKTIRTKITKIMEIVTAYVDRFAIFEHILNRVEYKFADGGFNEEYYENQFATDIINYKDGGIIQTRANEVLTKATDLLAEIEKLGLFTTIEKGIFADVKRPKDGGKGLSGVVVKDSVYFNPFIELMKGKVAAE